MMFIVALPAIHGTKPILDADRRMSSASKLTDFSLSLLIFDKTFIETFCVRTRHRAEADERQLPNGVLHASGRLLAFVVLSHRRLSVYCTDNCRALNLTCNHSDGTTSFRQMRVRNQMAIATMIT